MLARLVASGLIVLTLGCARPAPPGDLAESGRARAAVAVLPFRAGGTLDRDAVFASGGGEPPAAESGALVAGALADALAARGFAVADADATADALARAGAGAHDPAAAARVGRRLDVELVVLGAVGRFRQRAGSAWAAETPASVAYDAVLVRTSDGAVLARDGFDWTQQALSENLLQLPRFIEGGGRWLTREEMLSGAVRRSADRFAAALVPAG